LNYLAHAYLTPANAPQWELVGNFIGDFIKGNKYLQCHRELQQGLIRHRYIDTATDSHAAVHDAKQLFVPYYNHYSGIIVDTIWDYFLANDTQIFTSEAALQAYTAQLYTILQQHLPQLQQQYDWMPHERIQHLFTNMIKYNWLSNYYHITGIEQSLRGMSKRIQNMPDASEAIEIFKNNQVMLQVFYKELITDLRDEFLEE
jgi:acyl carrier protein phosphodiesterase